MRFVLAASVGIVLLGAALAWGADPFAAVPVGPNAVEALRKKGDWRRAMGAYVSLRDRFEKGCDEYVTYDAMAEILRGSPSGVYQQGATGAADPATSERRDAFQNLAKGFVVPKSSGSSGWGDSNWLERGGGIGGGGM